MMVDTLLLKFALIVKTADVFHITAPSCPVDQNHAEGNADDHSGGGDGVAQCDAVFPVERLETFRHAAHGAVAALKSDFKQISESGIHSEKRDQQKSHQCKTDCVLSPRQHLSEAQLGEGNLENLFQRRRDYSEEERCKDHVDHESGDFADCGNAICRENSRETLKSDQSQYAADD